VALIKDKQWTMVTSTLDEEKVEGPRWMECGSIIFLKNFDFFYFNLIFFGCF
jgi:hypothetical protein